MLVPMIVAFIALICGFALALYTHEQRESRDDCKQLFKAASGAFQAELVQESDKLAAALEAIVWNPDLRSEMLAGNTEALLARAKPLFEQMRSQNRITHFYFLSPERTCLDSRVDARRAWTTERSCTKGRTCFE